VDDGIPYLILEHDAYMIRPLPDVLEKFDEVLKLDSCNPFSHEYDNRVNIVKDDAVVPYNTSWGYKPRRAPYGAYFLGAWAYIIKPAAAEKILNAIKINGWVPADKQIGIQLLNLNATSNTIFRTHPQYNADNIHQMSITNKNDTV
jgi:GR25 family glycosyltransferase involved in LPS biosynthesis